MRISSLFLVLLMGCGNDSRTTVDAADGPGPGDASEVDASGDAGSGAGCGGFAGLKCAETEYCDYPDNHCGIADGGGRCRTRPDACPLNASGDSAVALVAEPTCGCDGRVYSSECFVYADGTDINANGTCEVPAGRFACGYMQCDLTRQYCVRQPRADAEADDYRCAPMTCEGNDVSCACVVDNACGGTCTGNASDGLTVTCPAGSP